VVSQIATHIFLHGHGMNEDRKEDTDKKKKQG
jgi:hypothetical protein